MKKKLFTVFVLLAFCVVLYAQDDYRVLLYNGPGNGVDNSRAIVMDGSGNVYITGNSFGGSSTDMDYCTIKYNAYGVQQWVARFNGTGSFTDQANAIAVDKYGNVFVTGWAHMEPGGLDCGTIDYVTIKYNANGVQQWMKRYEGPGGADDIAYAITIDDASNVYVTGSSYGGSSKDDIATIKYNSDGVQQWVIRYNGPSNDVDAGRAIGLDANGYVFVTGNSFQTSHGADFITIKYSPAGVQQWASRYNGPGNGDDIANALVVDLFGNVIVTGGSKGSTSNSDYATVKYDPIGVQQWVSRYNGPGNGIDESRGIVTDLSGNVFVTGYSMGTTTTNYDFATIMYVSDGSELWVKRYNGPANLIDKACGIAISRKPCSKPLVIDAPCWTYSIYVTGQSQASTTNNDYLTIKYDIHGDTAWTKRYNSTNNGDDIPSGIAAINNSEFVYVTGTTKNDYGTLWYYPTTQPLNVINGKNLIQNYPNPFNPTTKIGYALERDAFVTLKIYDVLGREVAVLVNNKLEAGTYETNWDASSFPSGVYFYTLESDGIKLDTKRMLLIK